MKFAEIYQVNFEPSVGTEIIKSRPAIIIGNDAAYKNLKMRLVVPVWHFEEKFLKSNFFPVLKPSKTNGLSKMSMVDCLQIKSFSTDRFQGFLGTVDEDDMIKIQESIALALNLLI